MRHLPISLIASFLMLFSIRITAQPGALQEWARIVGDPDSARYEYAAQIIPAEDGAFWLAGQWQDSALLMMVNSCGEVRWRKTYAFGSVSNLQGLSRLGEGSLLAAGYCDHCHPADSSRKMLLLHLGPDGSLLADTVLGQAGMRAEAQSVVPTSGGGAAVSGFQVVDPTWGFTDLVFLRFGADFSIQLNRSYDEANYEYAPALAQLADGGFALGGRNRAPLFGDDFAFLHHLDPEGNLIWAYHSDLPKTSFQAICQTADGRLYATGSHYVNTVQREDVYLAEIEAGSGQLVMDRHYGGGGPDYGQTLHAVEGGLLLGAEYRTPRLPNYGGSAKVYRLDYEGEVQDSSFYDGYLFSYLLRSLFPLTSDGRDYVVAGNHAFFGNRNIFLYRRSHQGYRGPVEAMPQDWQLYPRGLSLQGAPVEVSGSVSGDGASPYDQMRLRVFRNDSLYHEQAQPLNYIGGEAGYMFSWTLPSELASYTFRLEGLADGRFELEAQACEVVAGDAYIIQGQSNARAASEWSADSAYAWQEPYNEFVRTFGLAVDNDSLMRWHNEAHTGETRFADTRSGQWGLVLAKKIAAEQGVPVAILNGGIGGIAIDNMLPDPADPHSPYHSYGQFFQRVGRSGLSNHIRAILFFQGETNALQGYGETVDSYKEKYRQLRNAWEADFTFEREYLFQIRPGCWPGNFAIIQEAQRQLAIELPGAGIMSSTGMNHDGCHYHFFNGYQRAGEDIYRLLAGDLYGAPPLPDMNPPTVDSAWFSSCDRREITLRLQHGEDTYSWASGWEADFRLEGPGDVDVESGMVVGNTVVLSLSGAPADGFTGLTYTGHSVGSEASVKNANGIGMLAFYDFPVAPPEPLIETNSASICPGESFVLPDGAVVDTPGMYISEFISKKGCDSLIVTELAFFGPPAAPVLEVRHVSCHGEGDGAITAFPEGGTPPYNYLWNDGQATATATGLAPGMYTLTMTDSNGCEAVATAEMEEPPLLEASAMALTSASCPEASDGAATAIVTGGKPDYSFAWSTGQSAATATGLAPGMYSLTVTDANGCEATGEVQVTALAYEPGLAIEQENNTLTVEEQGASYQWVDCNNDEAIPGAIEGSYTPVESGLYAVIVSEGECSATSDCVDVMIVGTEEPETPRQRAAVFPNPSNGKFTLALPWGAEALLHDATGRLHYQNHFDPGAHQVEVDGLSSGVYFLRLQSDNGQQILKLMVK
ncbi:MAG: T9SS type A sorting domain-containing protein [Phaeodactylibacter sp.]|nr:T9SS type A sorting domain-containing protein [Phaeodactylibacter sp.]